MGRVECCVTAGGCHGTVDRWPADKRAQIPDHFISNWVALNMCMCTNISPNVHKYPTTSSPIECRVYYMCMCTNIKCRVHYMCTNIRPMCTYIWLILLKYLTTSPPIECTNIGPMCTTQMCSHIWLTYARPNVHKCAQIPNKMYICVLIPTCFPVEQMLEMCKNTWSVDVLN